MRQKVQRLDPGLHVPQPGTARRAGPRPTEAPERIERHADPQFGIPDSRTGQDPRHHPAHCPPDCKHVYWFYAVRFDPAGGRTGRRPAAVPHRGRKGVFKEGVLVGQWQVMPVPGQDLFHSMIGIGKRYPWAINEAQGITYNYDPRDYPVAQMLCDTYTNVHSIHPPNGLELNEKVVAAFHKVFSNLGEVMDHVDDDIQTRVSTAAVRSRMIEDRTLQRAAPCRVLRVARKRLPTPFASRATEPNPTIIVLPVLKRELQRSVHSNEEQGIVSCKAKGCSARSIWTSRSGSARSRRRAKSR
jgi:hypothetical protein